MKLMLTTLAFIFGYTNYGQVPYNDIPINELYQWEKIEQILKEAKK